MIRSVLGKVMWVGKATVFLVGLAVILALVFGTASMTFARDGQSFLLGERNVAQSLSTLVKQGAGPALSLQVDSGPPLKVDSAKKVANFNADKVDGLDAARLQGLPTLHVRSTDVGTLANNRGSGIARCRVGEQATGGGVSLVTGDSRRVFYFEPGGIPERNDSGQVVGWKSSWFTEVDSTVRIFAVCAS